MGTDRFIHIKQGDNPDYLTLIDDYSAYGIRVPKGFQWDGASSPRTPFARLIAPKYHRNIRASCVHDYLCSKAKDAKDRRYADEIYKRMLEDIEGVGWFRVKISYLAVRFNAWANGF